MIDRTAPVEDAGEIRVVDPDGLGTTEIVSGLVVRVPFRVGGRRQELLGVEERSVWHRHDGAVYGWVRAGSGRVEYGPGDAASVALAAGDFLRVPAGVVHRYVAVESDGSLELVAVVDGDGGAVRSDPPTGPVAGPVPEVVSSEGLVPAVGSPNLVRETPFPGGDVLTMRVRAAGGAAAGWHHHGENVYFGYAVDGPSETEYGPRGTEVARIEVGECFHVPPGLVHRDTNPGTEAHTGIVWLCGGEPWVVNVDGPA